MVRYARRTPQVPRLVIRTQQKEHGGRGIPGPGECGMRRQGAETLRFHSIQARTPDRVEVLGEIAVRGILNTGIRLAGLSVDDFAFPGRSTSPLDVASKYY